MDAAGSAALGLALGCGACAVALSRPGPLAPSSSSAVITSITVYPLKSAKGVA